MNKISQFLRCVISYTDVTQLRVLHYAVSVDYVEEFTQMIRIHLYTLIYRLLILYIHMILFNFSNLFKIFDYEKGNY